MRDDRDDEEMPSVGMTRRRFVLGCLLILCVVALLYYGVPRLAGLDQTWHRIEQGDPWWLALALVFCALSFGGYVLLFQYVFVEGGARIGLRESYEITMASLAATRIFAAGGAGGIALTAWAMRRSGMPRRTVAERTLVFLILTYVVYMVGMLVVGVGLRVGIFPGPAPFGLTVVPAVFAAVSILLTLLLALTPTDLQRRVDQAIGRGGWLARLAPKLATLPASMSAGVRHSIDHVRARDPAILGSIGFWLPTIPGAIAFFQLRRTVTRWREQRDTDPGRGAAAVAQA